jgi:hypothetical protein
MRPSLLKIQEAGKHTVFRNREDKNLLNRLRQQCCLRPYYIFQNSLSQQPSPSRNNTC